MVLYFGYKEHWKKAKSLHELFGEMPQEFKEIVNDYMIKVYEIAWLTEEQVASFRSDFRIVAEYFVQMQKTGDYHPLPKKMVHAREVIQLMCVLTNDKRFEKVYNECKKGKEPRTMCEVLDRVENRGLQKGLKKGLKKGRSTERTGRRTYPRESDGSEKSYGDIAADTGSGNECS